MLEAVLGFMADLILFTAGLAVITFWLAIFMAIAIEVHDLIFGEGEKEKEESDA
jgi:hypothetical protein